MDSLLTFALFIIVLILLLGIYAYALQCRLMRLDDTCNSAMRTLSLQFQSHWEAMQSLVIEIFKYAPDEGVALQSAINDVKNDSLDRPALLNGDGKAIEQVRRCVLSACSAYPINKTGEFSSVAKEISKDEKVVANIIRYNDAARKMNILVTTWPSKPVARALGFRRRKLA
ncbi:MAG: hypothetical protein II375_00300 [Bacteroidales bacterium]|nr:hypothetical protein [Bacteroidales bacterium]